MEVYRENALLSKEQQISNLKELLIQRAFEYDRMLQKYKEMTKNFEDQRDNNAIIKLFLKEKGIL